VRRSGAARCAVVGLALVACGGAEAPPPRPAGPPPFRLEIKAARDTNQGGPLVVVVRRTDRAGFLAEDYDAIAEGLFAEPRDPAVLRKEIVRPGQRVMLSVPRATKPGEVLGVYFLFAAPDAEWRLAIGDQKISRVRVVLGASGVESVEQRR
jgi:predicted component of type VI protein secretion system